MQPHEQEDETKTAVGERSTDRYGDGRAPEASQELQLAAGSAVGRFSILERVGAGGAGQVYAAYDPDLDRRVAIKLLRTPTGADAGEQTRRLLREARVLAQLRHKGIVAVYEVGSHDGRVFVAMEYVTGTTLAAWLREQKRDWKQVRSVMLDAGEGLAAAHAAGVVHRDFKPPNVMIEPRGRVVVLDFGLARPAEPDVSFTTPLPGQLTLRDHDVTVGGAVPGTLPYMAPELFSGTSGDARSDQFAFCVALHEALYRARPFVARTLAEHVAAVLAGVNVPKIASVPAWFRPVLERGLAADPAARFPSLDALLRALRRDQHRRRRRVFAGVAALAVSAAIGAGASYGVESAATEAQLDHIEQLAGDARDAADRGNYLVPPLDDADASTALARILELESTEGPAGAASREMAATLRSELAAALVQLGDEYENSPEGRTFAADFFVAALVFDPNNEAAREKAPVTTAQLSELRKSAAAGEFTPAQRVAHQPLAILADRKPRRRAKKAAAYTSAPEAPASARTQLQSALGTPAEAKAPPRTKVAAAPPKPESAPQEPTESKPAEPAATPSREVNPAASKAVAKEGRRAIDRGDYSTAATKFHRALQLNPRNRSALEGLAEVSFQTQKSSEAAGYLRKALRLAPKSNRLHRKLGDAYLNVLNYPKALQSYRTAKKLGDRKADQRIALVEARMGRGK